LKPLAGDDNQSLSVPEAMRRCHALDALGLAWIEEPTRQDDEAGMAWPSDMPGSGIDWRPEVVEALRVR
jgi:L-alanine-DL-glutamate epimerase-like enolase superfamily enzyme